MKHMIHVVLVMTATLAAYTSVVQAAGRHIDNPLPMNQRAVDSSAASSVYGIPFTGRPNDPAAAVRARGEEQAEFAVMDVQGDTTDHSGAVYHGRPLDNPGAVVR